MLQKDSTSNNVELFVNDKQSTIILSNALKQLRYSLLTNKSHISSKLRIELWCILLQIDLNGITTDYINGVTTMKEENIYLDWYKKIDQDISRTFINTSLSKNPTKQKQLKRILYLFAYNNNFYIQGMNVILAPILTMTDIEPIAYAIFDKSMLKLNNYYNESLSLDRIHNGCKLVETVLSKIDPKLYKKFNKLSYPLHLLVVPSIMTLSGNAEPVTEVLKMWDFIIAYGVHLNVLFIVAQLVIVRDTILKINSEEELFNYLRKMPKLDDGMRVVKLGIGFIDRLGRDFLQELIDHVN
ncbi:hypothetical protein HANVADRAFT_54225 [Hanseniaspora valbyensis NRRL Y-1626]|uniref:Rab-GAP TBC domain-containing protein n=1 Tax=Hanseniaspora valbyensis NRRL Y-1626 TaxID=766949 RepID=A0A1B7T876_9ASCO|nr:hypothetical protein HANVADRAFT_54225 [Hanseniaspora valbyensis NRRL Y-1626]